MPITEIWSEVIEQDNFDERLIKCAEYIGSLLQLNDEYVAGNLDSHGYQMLCYEYRMKFLVLLCAYPPFKCDEKRLKVIRHA